MNSNRVPMCSAPPLDMPEEGKPKCPLCNREVLPAERLIMYRNPRKIPGTNQWVLYHDVGDRSRGCSVAGFVLQEREEVFRRTSAAYNITVPIAHCEVLEKSPHG